MVCHMQGLSGQFGENIPKDLLTSGVKKKKKGTQYKLFDLR